MPELSRTRGAAAVACCLIAALVPLGASTSASATGPPVPSLRWTACDGGFQCATARVPMDYQSATESRPRRHGARPRLRGGGSIDIAVIRHRASDRAHRIGSLFFDPGGPGGSGTMALPFAYGQFPAAVRARFDIVGFDPRGVGASTAVRCFRSTDAETAFLARTPVRFPVGAAEEAAWESGYAGFDAICARRKELLLSHMSTADVARDMDQLRRAVGDPTLNYLGLSYGTVLGATYANLFPGKVRAMVLDGNLDPAAWTGAGNDTYLRVGADESSAATLTAFLDRCGSVPATRCAFSAGTPAATEAKLATLFGLLRQHPVVIGAPARPSTFTYASTVSNLIDILYTTSAEPGPLGMGWPAGALLLQRLWAAATSPPANPVTPAPSPAAPTPVRYNGPEQEFGVVCPESPNPRDPGAYPELAALAYVRSGDVGPYWAWKDEACSSWPATSADDYTGPWNRATAKPILLIGNTGDPATPYKGSVAMSRELARARLLTVDGYGHTELLNKSACADAYETGYLLDGTLPATGTICLQNITPFAAPGTVRSPAA